MSTIAELIALIPPEPVRINGASYESMDDLNEAIISRQDVQLSRRDAQLRVATAFIESCSGTLAYCGRTSEQERVLAALAPSDHTAREAGNG